MNNSWIYNCISERLGGALFEKNSGYKFEIIKQVKKVFIESHPNIALMDFGIGDPNDIAPKCAIETLEEYSHKWQYGGYADNGAEFFKASICKYMRSLFHIEDLTHENILPILGIKSGLCLLAGALINENDLVAYTVPGYGVFATQTQYLLGKTLPLKLTRENNFLPDLKSLSEEIKKNIKILVLNYPNNPTGAVATKQFFEEIVHLALKYHWIVIHDAAYSALSFETPISILEILNAKACCIELHSMSKGFNMTGWRIGWLCGNKTIVKACEMYKTNCDSGQFLAIQKAACEALKIEKDWLPPLRDKYKLRLSHLVDILNRYGFNVSMPKAGFFLYVRAPQKAIKSEQKFTFTNAEECSHWFLTQLGIVVVPWDESGKFLRFSVTFRTNDETNFFKELVHRLKDYTFLFENN